MKPPIEFRPSKTEKTVVDTMPLSQQYRAEILDNLAVLAHKRAVKAAQMRRYRARAKKS